MRTSRRDFVKGACASLGFAFAGGRPVFSASSAAVSSETPLLRFGVLSDTHLRVAKDGTSFLSDGSSGYDDTSDARIRKAFSFFKANGTDAVVHCGDMAHNAITKEMEFHKTAWDAVFSGYTTSFGAEVKRLFVTGNHDIEGFCYGTHAASVYGTNTYLSGLLVDDFSTLSPAAKWSEIWGEEYEEVWHKTVNGYHFFGCNWMRSEEDSTHYSVTYNGTTYLLYKGESVYTPADGIENSVLLSYAGKSYPKAYINGFRMVELIEQARSADADFDKKPFFVVTHYRPAYVVNKALGVYANGLSFFGHWHRSAAFWDSSNSVTWPSGVIFPEIQCPSLAYGGGVDMPSTLSFAKASGNSVDNYALKLVGGEKPNDYFQGYFVLVYSDRIVIERRDFDLGNNDCTKLGPDWVVPALDSASAPWGYSRTTHPLTQKNLLSQVGTPQFPSSAALSYSVDDSGLTLTIPNANGNSASRALIYNIEIVGDSSSLWKSVYAAGCNDGIGHEWNDGVTEYTIDAMEIPKGSPLTVRVYPVSALGTTGEALCATLSVTCVPIKVTVDKKIAKVKSARRFVLTEGAGLPENANLDFERPSWASKLCVEDGEIVLYTKPDPLFMSIR